MRYAEARDLFDKARNKDAGKALENNTRLFQRGRNYAVRLHSTDVVTILPNDTHILNTGGWRTVTTKARINDYSHARVWSKRGTWYVNGEPFADGCRVKANGTVIGAGRPKEVQEEKIMRRRAAEYARDYVTALYAGDIPAPSAGDCWGCCMRTADGQTPMGGKDHILSHFSEKYYVPSLAVNAFESFGASSAMKHNFAVLTQKPEGISLYPGDWLREQMQRFIRRYCLRQLGVAA